MYSYLSDSLHCGRYGNQIPVVVRFSAPVWTGRGIHPTSYSVGTGSFLRVKQLGHHINYPPPFSAKFKERVELFLYTGCSWPVIGWTFNHSTGVCRMRRFIAVLRKFFQSSLLHTFSCHPSPPTILPSSLTSSCHLYLGLPLNLVVPKFIYNSLLGILHFYLFFNSYLPSPNYG